MRNIRVSDDAYEWFQKIVTNKKNGFSSDTECLLRLLNMTEHYNVKFYRKDTSKRGIIMKEKDL